MNPYPWPEDVYEALRKAQDALAKSPEGADPWAANR